MNYKRVKARAIERPQDESEQRKNTERTRVTVIAGTPLLFLIRRAGGRSLGGNFAIELYVRAQDRTWGWGWRGS